MGQRSEYGKKRVRSASLQYLGVGIFIVLLSKKEKGLASWKLSIVRPVAKS